MRVRSGHSPRSGPDPAATTAGARYSKATVDGTPTASVDSWYAIWKTPMARPPPRPRITSPAGSMASLRALRRATRARRSAPPTRGRRRARLSGGTPRRKRWTAKIPEEPQREAAPTASAYPASWPRSRPLSGITGVAGITRIRTPDTGGGRRPAP